MRVGTQLLVLHRNIDVPGVQRTHSNAGNDGRAGRSRAVRRCRGLHGEAFFRTKGVCLTVLVALASRSCEPHDLSSPAALIR